MMSETVHVLKTWARYFDAVADGRKPFEVRRNDRAFQAGDIVELVKVENDFPHGYVMEAGSRFTMIKLRRRILYLLQGGQFGIDPGFCVLGLGEVDHQLASAAATTNNLPQEGKAS